MNAWNEVQIISLIADLKEQHYQTLLLTSALAEVLIDKGLLTREQITQKASHLEATDFLSIFQDV